MLKYKICPSCQTKNDPTLLECFTCEADLTRVKVTDEEAEKMHEENATSAATYSGKQNMVRICECGQKNPPNARKCSACDEEISDITPTPDTSLEETSENTQVFVLSSHDGQYVYRITAEEVVVGREQGMSAYLAQKSYVSRSHAKLTIENGELFVENLSSTNYTYVNNQRISQKTKLKDEDELGLGGTSINGARQNEAAYFIVRNGQCM